MIIILFDRDKADVNFSIGNNKKNINDNDPGSEN